MNATRVMDGIRAGIDGCGRKQVPFTVLRQGVVFEDGVVVPLAVAADASDPDVEVVIVGVAPDVRAWASKKLPFDEIGAFIVRWWSAKSQVNPVIRAALRSYFGKGSFGGTVACHLLQLVDLTNVAEAHVLLAAAEALGIIGDNPAPRLSIFGILDERSAAVRKWRLLRHLADRCEARTALPPGR